MVVVISEYLRDRFFDLVNVIILSDGWEECLLKENECGFVLGKVKSILDDLVYIVYLFGIIGKLKGRV